MKPLSRWWLAAAAMFAGAASATTTQLQIELRPHAQVTTQVVRLGDVARVQSSDDAVARSVAAITLGPAPKVGEPSSLTHTRISAWLSRHAELTDQRWQLTGATSVSIDRAAQTLAGDVIEAAARHSLTEWLSTHTDRHTVELVAAVPAAQVPAGDWSLQARAWPAALQPGPRIRTWIDVIVAGQPVRAIPVDFRVQAFGKRWVMQRNAVAGQTLTADDVALHTTDLALSGGISPGPSPVGLTLKAHVRSGQVLRATQVETPQAVERGGQVTIRSQAGAISLTTTARALQNGQPGQRIRVQPAGAQTWVEAQVVSNAVVEVTP